MDNNLTGNHIHITGIVQGVGFRPFIFTLATQLKLTGWVKNTSAGVDIYIESDPASLNKFLEHVRNNPPPLAKIDSVQVKPSSLQGLKTFEIIQSQSLPDAFQPISPDVSICDDCLYELFNPADRRYFYPFINCTNCGPRFTIIKDVPYDRPYTTMARFEMCAECYQEYSDPLDRRFHAQPIACPQCGPRIWLEYSQENRDNAPKLSETSSISVICNTKKLLKAGKIVAIKGLGGFHLACDALNTAAVERLRNKKLRVEKPFAIMMFSIDQIERNCYLTDEERALLISVQRPIVILERREDSNISRAIAPNQDTLGVMLPYTPLHYLLLEPETEPNESEKTHAVYDEPILVMTSGNFVEEPIATDNQEALRRLSSIADAFLMHDRPIHLGCDDSVIHTVNFQSTLTSDSPDIKSTKQRTIKRKTAANIKKLVYPLRRSRGYAPYPIFFPTNALPILAVGAELKNTFCITRDRYAFISQHIGDLENYETYRSFIAGIQHFEKVFRSQPKIIAYDLHPDYLSTKYALERAGTEDIRCIGVQHHHAHIASCMIENQIHSNEVVIGVSFDGTGYGSDGAIWGGEFLLSDYISYQRVAHLAYRPLPGGDTAIHKPARIALAYLWHAGVNYDEFFPSVNFLSEQEIQAIQYQLENGLNTPQTSSMGRLFDAVAAIIGVRQEINYEAQAAIELEAIASTNKTDRYQFGYTHNGNPENNGPILIDPDPVIHSIIKDMKSNVSTSDISARFHEGTAHMVAEMCCRLRETYSINIVVLSGGVWQNLTLLKKTLMRLKDKGFSPYLHHQVPPNDGGISLGQAVIAAYNSSRNEYI